VRAPPPDSRRRAAGAARLRVPTGYVIAATGFGPLEAVSLLVLGLFAFGIVGALRRPPE